MKQIFFMMISLVVFIVVSAQTSALNQKEKDAIIYMREEEKLARDVYNFLFEKWEMNPFGNIRQSEQTHMDRIKILITTYKLEDPVAKNGDKPGVFSNSFLQNLYIQLTKSGSESVTAALKAGAKIEELDIADLEERIAQTTNREIINTFNYLKQASENHLRAFTRRLKAEGVNYEPVILTKERFTEIIASVNKGGNGNQRGKGSGACCNN
ncbi:MAG TPA: DUF2202 domain-containing protein [Chitinophagaceae bacterium]